MNREQKFEIRNPTTPPQADACCPLSSRKSETNSKFEIPMTQTLAPDGSFVSSFRFWSFGFVSDFVLRISNLCLNLPFAEEAR
jgi:hypothetical protein